MTWVIYGHVVLEQVLKFMCQLELDFNCSRQETLPDMSFFVQFDPSVPALLMLVVL